MTCSLCGGTCSLQGRLWVCSCGATYSAGGGFWSQVLLLVSY